MHSSGSRNSDCEMYKQYMMLLEKPVIFFTQVILFAHRINYCTFKKIITLQTQNILLPSPRPFLFRRKWVYFIRKLTKLH